MGKRATLAQPHRYKSEWTMFISERFGMLRTAIVTAAAAAALGLFLPAVPALAQGASGASLDRIGHIFVVYLENRSFDNLFGHFPGANGLDNADGAVTQVDKEGKPYAALPPVIEADAKPPRVDERFPKDLPNGPFAIDKYVPIDQPTGDLVHRWYQERAQIDGGKMDKFVAYSDAATLSMGYYDIGKTSIWRYAKDYTLADNYFHGTFGGSYMNHIWLVCGCITRYPGAPEEITAKVDAAGNMLEDGAVTPDGIAVNTIYSVNAPHPASAKPETLLPSQKGLVTVGDQLSERQVSWAWYGGGWNDALAGHPDKLFEYHHQPFVYFAQFADGTAAKKDHLKDEADLFADIKAGRLPAVAFWKPIGAEDQHPGYAELVMGDHKVEAVISAIQASPAWSDTVIIITYDENGGFWDHVAPPKLDQWGPGTRVPLIVVSPFARRGYIDHTLYDTTSILKLIHERYNLAPLSDREAKVGDLSAALAP